MILIMLLGGYSMYHWRVHQYSAASLSCKSLWHFSEVHFLTAGLLKHHGASLSKWCDVTTIVYQNLSCVIAKNTAASICQPLQLYRLRSHQLLLGKGSGDCWSVPWLCWVVWPRQSLKNVVPFHQLAVCMVLFYFLVQITVNVLLTQHNQKSTQ